jgi:hypothetical protein
MTPNSSFSSSSGHTVKLIDYLFRPQDCNRLVSLFKSSLSNVQKVVSGAHGQHSSNHVRFEVLTAVFLCWSFGY